MRVCLSLLSLWLLAVTATISAEDWNQFRGAAGNGKTLAELPLEFSESDGVAWKVPLPGKAWSSPVIWKKQIRVTNALPPGRAQLVLPAGEVEYSLEDLAAAATGGD